jgi:hypothetical protein
MNGQRDANGVYHRGTPEYAAELAAAEARHKENVAAMRRKLDSIRETEQQRRRISEEENGYWDDPTDPMTAAKADLEKGS